MFYLKMMNRLISLFAIFICLLIDNGWSQPAYKATLPIVDTTGFYRIDLPYEVLGVSCPDLRDIRIRDDKDREVAWLLRKDEERICRNEFVPFHTEISTGKYRTDVLVETDRKPVSSFVMRIKNADSDKSASLLGSYDRKTWFTVSEHIRLNDLNNPNDTETFIELKFPLSDYSYYRVSIKDSLSSPLNIVGAGFFRTETAFQQTFIHIPAKKSEIHANGKYTDIKMIFPFKSRVSELVFYVSAPQYYKRSIKLHPPYTTGMLVADKGKPLTVVCDLYTDTLTISVNNGDDMPLAIDSIKAYTPGFYLIANLRHGEHYTMTYGDEKASFPEYDLSFGIHVSDSISRIIPGRVERMPASQQMEPSLWMSFLKTYGIWIIIILIILQILYVVRKLLK